MDFILPQNAILNLSINYESDKLNCRNNPMLCTLMAYSKIQAQAENMMMLSLDCLWHPIIGTGLLLFHLTMCYSIQLFDEVPMFFLMASLQAWKARSQAHDLAAVQN